jgi:chaperonin GroES
MEVEMFKPLHDKVLVQQLEAKSVTSGGIYIPDDAKEKPTRGKVIEVGDGEIKEDGSVRPLSVKVGDEILFSSYAGTPVTIDDEEYLIMREADLLGVIQEGK